MKINFLLFIERLWHYFADSGGRSVGIVRLRAKATEVSFSLWNDMIL
jgi:hypothetical protein